MASLGLTKTQGGNMGDPLTVAWKQAVQAQLQSDEDRIEALKAVHDGTAIGIAMALHTPVRVALALLAVCAASALAVVGFKAVEVFRG